MRAGIQGLGSDKLFVKIHLHKAEGRCDGKAFGSAARTPPHSDCGGWISSQKNVRGESLAQKSAGAERLVAITLRTSSGQLRWLPNSRDVAVGLPGDRPSATADRVFSTFSME